MVPALPTRALNVPPWMTPPVSLRTAKPLPFDPLAKIPSTMTPLFRTRFSPEASNARPVSVNAYPAWRMSLLLSYVHPVPDVSTGAPFSPIWIVTGMGVPPPSSANATLGTSEQARTSAVTIASRRFPIRTPFGCADRFMVARRGWSDDGTVSICVILRALWRLRKRHRANDAVAIAIATAGPLSIQKHVLAPENMFLDRQWLSLPYPKS